MSSLTDPEKTQIISGGKSTGSLFEGNEREGGLWPVGSVIERRYRVVDVRGGRGITGMGVVYILDDGERTSYAQCARQPGIPCAFKNTSNAMGSGSG